MRQAVRFRPGCRLTFKATGSALGWEPSTEVSSGVEGHCWEREDLVEELVNPPSVKYHISVECTAFCIGFGNCSRPLSSSTKSSWSGFWEFRKLHFFISSSEAPFFSSKLWSFLFSSNRCLTFLSRSSINSLWRWRQRAWFIRLRSRDCCGQNSASDYVDWLNRYLPRPSLAWQYSSRISEGAKLKILAEERGTAAVHKCFTSNIPGGGSMGYIGSRNNLMY